MPPWWQAIPQPPMQMPWYTMSWRHSIPPAAALWDRITVRARRKGCGTVTSSAWHIPSPSSDPGSVTGIFRKSVFVPVYQRCGSYECRYVPSDNHGIFVLYFGIYGLYHCGGQSHGQERLYSMFIVIMGSCVFRVIWVYTVFAYFHTIPSLYLLYVFSWSITAVAEIRLHYIPISNQNGSPV